MNADQIGKAVKRWCKSAAAYKLLDANPSTKGATWQAGGCVLLAYGLHNLLPGSVVVGLIQIRSDGVEQIGHVGVLYQGKIIDADGAYASAAYWSKFWNDHEASPGVRFGSVVNVDDVDPEELPLPNDQQGAEEVSEALKPIIGISSAQRKATLLEAAALRIGRIQMGTFTKPPRRPPSAVQARGA